MRLENIEQTLLELGDVLMQLSDEQFGQALPIFSGSSIGMHARHILEFYHCLFAESEQKNSVNYDKRRRDLRLQSDVNYFITNLNAIRSNVSALETTRLDTPLSIFDDETLETPILSSVSRELQYNLEHTIHHAAIIKIGILSIKPDCNVPATFGVAPSTRRFQQKLVAQ